ncbi:hypothetical protein OIU79_022648 [Salix purpurea]|uniref:Uncharacterized protein n=1 Tax=Salix purpurea TaxID=77065 RepID=A0A9Q0WGB9_SALPP|nr:hypothetical protein OIU79_022648 [Salix purpurea]
MIERNDKHPETHPLAPFFLIFHNPCICPFCAHQENHKADQNCKSNNLTPVLQTAHMAFPFCGRKAQQVNR